MQLYMSWYIRSFFGFTFLNIFFSSTLLLTSSIDVVFFLSIITWVVGPIFMNSYEAGGINKPSCVSALSAYLWVCSYKCKRTPTCTFHYLFQRVNPNRYADFIFIVLNWHKNINLSLYGFLHSPRIRHLTKSKATTRTIYNVHGPQCICRPLYSCALIGCECLRPIVCAGCPCSPRFANKVPVPCVNGTWTWSSL